MIYWIADAKTKTVRVYDFMADKEYNYTFTDTINVRIYGDLDLTLADLDEV